MKRYGKFITILSCAFQNLEMRERGWREREIAELVREHILTGFRPSATLRPE